MGAASGVGGDAGTGLFAGRPHPAEEWTISARVTHPVLITEADFVAAQSIRAARKVGNGTVRMYALAGLVRCGVGGRRMDSHWINRSAWLPVPSRAHQQSVANGGSSKESPRP